MARCVHDCHCLSASPCRQNRRCVVPKVRPTLSKQLICPTGHSKNALTLSHGASAGTKEYYISKQRLNYSSSKVSENGMWGPSATLQDVCTPANVLQGPVAQNFRNADAYRRYFWKGSCCRWLGWGGGQQVL